MTFVVAVTLVVKRGAEARVTEILQHVALLTRSEPGCLDYSIHRSLESPSRFFIYERYVDEAAFRADQASEHFREYILGEAVALLDRSERTVYEELSRD